MKATLCGDIDFVYEDMDPDEDSFDMDEVIDEINENLYGTLQDADYVKNIIDSYIDYNGPDTGNILNDIIDVYIDEDCIYVELDTVEMDEKEFVDAFKDILTDFILDSDTTVSVTVYGTQTHEDYNPLTDVIYYREKETEWDGEVSLEYGVSNCRMIKEEN